jgi:preprotein translocase subunit SecG
MSFFLVIHVVVCLFIIFVVLLQPGTRGGMGAAFGGAGSATVFGGRGANTLLSKITAGAAFSFMITCSVLVYYSTQRGSVFEQVESQGLNAKNGAENSEPVAIETQEPENVEEVVPTNNEEPPVAEAQNAESDAVPVEIENVE